ncbi:MAG: molybdopterin-dependent oxidoreductase [Cyanobacteria bacterium J06634_6]
MTLTTSSQSVSPSGLTSALPSIPPNEADFGRWGSAEAFLAQYAESADMRSDVQLQRLHARLTRQASVCSYCGVGCPYGVVLDKRQNKKVVPLSKLGLCVKGATSLMTGGDALREQRLRRRGQQGDRIRTPMIRSHNGTWKEVSWAEALDRAAWLFLHVREWVGPDGVAIYGNGQKTAEAIWMASLYKLLFKVSTLGANSEHCLASAGAAHELNFGNEASFTWQAFEELELCDVAVLHGTNPLVTFPQAYKKLKRNTSAIKVVIDPVANDTVIDLQQTEPTALHIRFEQGGDILFNLAVSRIILDNGWQNDDFLSGAVDSQSFTDFKDLVADDRYETLTVAKQIALEGDDPEELAETIYYYATLIALPDAHGNCPKVAFVSSMGINQSTGSYGFSTNLNLLLLTGNVGRRGAGSLRIAGQSNATSELMLGFNARRLVFNLSPTNAPHRQQLAQILEIPEHNIADKAGTPVARMSEDDSLYCFIFLGTQFTKNMPRLGQWLRRLGRSFNIVVDSFLPEGALDYADVILPALSYTEKQGVIQRGDRTLQLQQPLTEAPPMAWSDEQVMARLALAIAQRLQDTDTAALNNLDPDVIKKAFGRYCDPAGKVDSAKVFDHLVDVSRQLNVYNRLETAEGEPISHGMLRSHAGKGIQWQGDARYQGATRFPKLFNNDRHRARLVRPPEALLQRLVTKGDEKIRSLITGRGRPGRNPKAYTARYNSGIKTRSIGAKETDPTYWIELNPQYAAKHALAAGDPVRITSYHGTLIGRVSLNEHVPAEFPFLDFVPGEANRLTDYLDADQFTHQSLIKRTPVRVERLSLAEATLWKAPHLETFLQVVETIAQQYQQTYPTADAADKFSRGEPDALDWLPAAMLRQPAPHQQPLAEAVGAMATLFQQYSDHADYRAQVKELLQQLDEHPRDGEALSQKDRVLSILLPLLRKLEHDTLLMSLFDDIVGPIKLQSATGNITEAHLKAAHQSAVIEIKEEVVGVQLFLAIKHGLDLLYGPGSVVPQADIAIISGIKIPCAADVPAYLLGISPAEITSSQLIHCAHIGSDSIVVCDRKHNRAVKIETTTGILPYDKELLHLRNAVIMKKRAASRQQHRRFFDRLIELIASFVRVGAGNFRVVEPFALPWEEFSRKLAFLPWQRRPLHKSLIQAALSPTLVQSLVKLEILDAVKDEPFIYLLSNQESVSEANSSAPSVKQAFTGVLTSTQLSTEDKVREVIAQYISPVLENDGGKIELMNFDAAQGEVTVRFLGSCANCPSSILSVETIVKPPLLSIPGVYKVRHRTHLQTREIPVKVVVQDDEKSEVSPKKVTLN